MTRMEKNCVRVVVENLVIPLKSAGDAISDCDAEACRKAEGLIKKAAGRSPSETRVRKRSVDARRKGDLRLVYSVVAGFDGVSEKLEARLLSAGIKSYTEPCFDPPVGKETLHGDVVVVGFGPAGMFCALELAERGYRPVVYERGSSVEKRAEKVSSFLAGGPLDPECNVQFGAGGAGTFSDGKLMTRIGDGRVSYILEKLARFGAPDDVTWTARPHIGTDLLRGVVSNIDGRIRSLGGQIFYDSAVSVGKDGFFVRGEKLRYSAIVLAVGHSARDTYAQLMREGYRVVPKPFSAGVRIEHPQQWLDRSVYGDLAGSPLLGHAEYSLSHRTGNRGVYSFCMCPGGVVLAAASEAGGVVTNGMSNRRRDGRCANAALAVSVLPEDYGCDPASAIEFQRRLERAAYAAGGGDYSAPVQLVGDFLNGTPSRKTGAIAPTYMDGKVTPADLRALLPPFIGGALEAGLGAFDKRMPGFARADVPMTGFETRTSSPVRITRGESLEADGRCGVYPCGEGAGYAGGIVSAAVDGLRVAEAIISKYSPD